MDLILLGHSDGQVTIAQVPGVDDGWTEDERFNSITHNDAQGNRGAWVYHEHLSGGGAPAWVAGEDPVLVDRLAEHYGCPVGHPAGQLEVTE